MQPAPGDAIRALATMRIVPLPAQLRLTWENSPSKVAPTAKPLCHFTSADANFRRAASHAANRGQAERLVRGVHRAEAGIRHASSTADEQSHAFYLRRCQRLGGVHLHVGPCTVQFFQRVGGCVELTGNRQISSRPSTMTNFFPCCSPADRKNRSFSGTGAPFRTKPRTPT